jgi:hypothetical protein
MSTPDLSQFKSLDEDWERQEASDLKAAVEHEKWMTRAQMMMH